jgi:hypothetical protein
MMKGNQINKLNKKKLMEIIGKFAIALENS